MPIIFIESQYPVSKNKEVVATWLSGLEKYPRPEGLFTPLVDTAVSSHLNGIRVRSGYQTNPGKYEEALAYFSKFLAEFFEIEGYAYEINTWLTIEEAMDSIDQKAPER